MKSIEQARREVETTMKKVVWLAERKTGKATEIEQEVWTASLQLARAVRSLFFAQRAAQPRPTRYEHEGRHFKLAGRQITEVGTRVGTRFGTVQLLQPVGECTEAAGGARDLPLMRELGLPAGFTLPVVTLSEGSARCWRSRKQGRFFESLFDWTPSPRAVLRMVDATGEQARPFLEQTPAPDGDGDILVIEMDGKSAPAISSREHARRTQPRTAKAINRRHSRRAKRRANPRPRRAPGKKTKNATVAAVGALYTLQRNHGGKLEGRLNKRVYATFESYRALFEWLQDEAKKRGHGTKKFTEVLFLADGAEVLWNLNPEFFSDAQECLDWFHVVEKLWDARKAICRGTRRQLKKLEAWAAKKKKKKELRAGKVQAIIAELSATLDEAPVTGPGNKYHREVLERVVNHFTNNAARMRYKKLRSDDLPIASGVLEGAVRNLVGVRLEAPGHALGTRPRRGHPPSTLRAPQWAVDAFEKFLANRSGFRLRAQPVPTRTHDAKPATKKAA